jgi:hypothetical protein
MNLRIVMPSIIDPVSHRGGAGATEHPSVEVAELT